MTSIELLVRPFQTRDVTPPAIIPGEPKEIEIPILLIGSDDAKTFKLDVAITTNVNVVTETNYTETSRQTVTKRITNPDDPNQHVDVENTVQSEVKDQAANPMSPKSTDKLNIRWKS